MQPESPDRTLTSEERNVGIGELNDFDFRDQTHALTFLLGGGTLDEKPVCYMGWYWREVDFDQDISLAVTNEGLTGFCENNKWGYREFRLTPEQKVTLLGLIDRAIETRDPADIAAINPYMQTLGEPQKGKGYSDD